MILFEHQANISLNQIMLQENEGSATSAILPPSAQSTMIGVDHDERISLKLAITDNVNVMNDKRLCDISHIEQADHCEGNLDSAVIIFDLDQTKARSDETNEEAENTPPSEMKLAAFHTHYSHSPHHHHFHRKYHPYHHHLRHHSLQTNNYVIHSRDDVNGIDDDNDASHDDLPLSPSITPPIVMSPPSSDTSSPLSTTEDCDEEQTDDLIDDIVLHSYHGQSTTIEEICDNDQCLNSTKCDSRSITSSPNVVKGDRSPLLVSNRRHKRSHHRYLPYSTHNKNLEPTSILRPINIDQKSKIDDHPESGSTSANESSVFAIGTTTTITASFANKSKEQCDTPNSATPDRIDHCETSIPLDSDCQDRQTIVGPDDSSLSYSTSLSAESGTEPLHIDTSLANTQSATVQAESYHSKTNLAQQILSVIRNDDFERFLSILDRSKPDLNVFINGQTALHYCLLLGEFNITWVHCACT